jgi:hypothetical protein
MRLRTTIRNSPAGQSAGQYIIRRANDKSLAAIHAEIRNAQQAPVGEGATQIGGAYAASQVRLFSMLPKFARALLVWRRLQRDPFFMKSRRAVT